MALTYMPRILNFDLIRASYFLCKAPKYFKVQSASITSKENRDPTIKKPDPWPYETKKFTFFRGFFEGTVKRFDENTKIIVVDGNIGAGKSSFAKQLAEAFDMLYLPEPTLDKYYITEYGYDIRKLDDLFPHSFKCCDINTFYKNPHHHNVGQFQGRMYLFRLEQYLHALAHVLNTGQGVVLERCVYGDRVFADTMFKFGYLSQPVMDYYNDAEKNSLEELLRPHLIIYLDVSPEVALERIKKRNNPVEVNSKVLTKEYLETIEHFYKQNYLKKMEEHAELLVYDWNNFGDIEVVIEDIERIDFERFSIYDKKLSDWRKKDDWDWNYYRRFYTNEKSKIMNYAIIWRPKVTELHHPADEAIEYRKIIKQIPGEKYTPGFNPDAGDNYLFKLHTDYWRTRWTRYQPR